MYRLILIFLIFYRNSIKEKEKDFRKRSKNRTTFPKNVLSVGKSNKYIKIQKKKIETTHEKSFSTIFLHKIIFSTYRFMWTRADYTKIGMNASPSLYKQIAERRERGHNRGISSIETRISGSTLEIRRWNRSDYCAEWAVVDPRTPQLLFVTVRPILCNRFSTRRIGNSVFLLDRCFRIDYFQARRSIENHRWNLDEVCTYTWFVSYLILYYCRLLRSVNFFQR